VTDESTPGWAGHNPDVLGSMANERNGLAWQRTALSWVASGATVARYFASGGILRARTSIGLLMIAVGALIWIDGARHYQHRAHKIRADEPTRIPAGTLRIVSIATTIVIATIIAIETANL
jgi:uncharacterized membrane protein YidH (DUF202 family)